MDVILLVSMAGPAKSYKPGDIYPAGDNEGSRLIAAGMAKLAEAETLQKGDETTTDDAQTDETEAVTEETAATTTKTTKASKTTK